MDAKADLSLRWAHISFCWFCHVVAHLILVFVLGVHAIEPGHEKTCLMSFADNKSADQPAHPRSLISAFVSRCLDSVMSLVSVTKISSLLLASVAEQASLSLTWSETPEDTFSHGVAQFNSFNLSNIIVLFQRRFLKVGMAAILVTRRGPFEPSFVRLSHPNLKKPHMEFDFDRPGDF